MKVELNGTVKKRLGFVETVRELIGAGDMIYISYKIQRFMISFFLARYHHSRGSN